LSKPIQPYVEKRIGEISSTDRIVRVNAQVYKTDPFIIEDGSGKALVKSACNFKELDKIRIIGFVFFNKNGDMPEIEPIAIQGMNEFDYDLYSEMQQIRNQVGAGLRHGK
jgi:hypothetical protein